MTSEASLSMSATSIAATSNVVVTYRTPWQTVDALRDVSLDIAAGATTALCGPSGSGKSSLLRLFGLFDQPTSGTVRIADADMSSLSERARRRIRLERISFVHQRPLANLISDLRVAEHITFVRQVRRLRRTDPLPVLDRFGLARLAGSWPVQLSGGEQQRLAFAMAVAGEPTLILADEPTAELDHHHALEVIETIAGLEAIGASTIVASHDPAVVAAASHVVYLREGRLVS